MTEIERLKQALQEIADIQDQPYGGDWEEIEHARNIANAALKGEPLPENPFN